MYHVSPAKGLTELEPRIPEVGGEITTPRVCAAPTVLACLEGMEWNLECKVYYVYQIDQEPSVDNVNVTEMVLDAVDTGEVWYLTPVPCVCVGTIDDYI